MPRHIDIHAHPLAGCAFSVGAHDSTSRTRDPGQRPTSASPPTSKLTVVSFCATPQSSAPGFAPRLLPFPNHPNRSPSPSTIRGPTIPTATILSPAPLGLTNGGDNGLAELTVTEGAWNNIFFILFFSHDIHHVPCSLLLEYSACPFTAISDRQVTPPRSLPTPRPQNGRRQSAKSGKPGLVGFIIRFVGRPTYPRTNPCAATTPKQKEQRNHDRPSRLIRWTDRYANWA